MPHDPPYYSDIVILCGHLMNSKRCMSSICVSYVISPMVEAARPLRLSVWSQVGGGEWNYVSASGAASRARRTGRTAKGSGSSSTQGLVSCEPGHPESGLLVQCVSHIVFGGPSAVPNGAE